MVLSDRKVRGKQAVYHCETCEDNLDKALFHRKFLSTFFLISTQIKPKLKCLL